MNDADRGTGRARRVLAALSSRRVMLPFSLAVTAVALWLAVRDADLARVGKALRGMTAWPFVVSFACLVLGTLARGARFHALTRRATGAGYLPALEMILVGYFFTSILPARAGELVRIGYFARRADAPLLTTTTAVVVERAMDLIALAILAAIVLSGAVGRRFPDLPVPPWILAAAGGTGGAGALVAGALLRRRTARGRRAIGKWARRFDEAVSGLAALASPRDAALAMGLSLALWLLVSFSVQTAFRAGGMDVPFADAAVVMLGTCFAIALPSSPGFVGTYHLGFVEGARLVGIAPEVSLPVAIVLHLVIQVPFLPIGGLVLLTGGRRALARPIRATRDTP